MRDGKRGTQRAHPQRDKGKASSYHGPVKECGGGRTNVRGRRDQHVHSKKG